MTHFKAKQIDIVATNGSNLLVSAAMDGNADRPLWRGGFIRMTPHRRRS